MAMDDEIDLPQFIEMVNQIAQTLRAHEQELDALDNFVGDGDHGRTLGKGMRAVEEELAQADANAIDEVLELVGRTLLRNMGGAMGPLLATFFKGMAIPARGKTTIDLEVWSDMVAGGAMGVRALGKASPGDKTMLDAIVPAESAILGAVEARVCLRDAARSSAEAAIDGANRTCDMVARAGRARNLGERSRGYKDAGAQTMALIFSAINEYLDSRDS